MRCVKLPGERILPRDFKRQVAKLQISAALLNRFPALGTPLTQRAEQVCPGKCDRRPSRDLHNKAGSSDKSVSIWVIAAEWVKNAFK